MGDVASSLISASTEELLREAACAEVKSLTQEYRLALAQVSSMPSKSLKIIEFELKTLLCQSYLSLKALFLSVVEERQGTRNQKVKWKLKRRTWKSYNR